jgi:hypothetical protein
MPRLVSQAHPAGNSPATESLSLKCFVFPHGFPLQTQLIVRVLLRYVIRHMLPQYQVVVKQFPTPSALSTHCPIGLECD